MLPPRPLPAHYSLAVLRMCVHVSHLCAHALPMFFSSAIETRITAPTLSQASASLPPLILLLPCGSVSSKRSLLWPDMELGENGWET